jgi:hypothetical protein
VQIVDARVALCVLAARESGDHLYIWGGDSADEGGFDCSGFVCDLLMRANRLIPGIYYGGRTTAHTLHEYYDALRVPDVDDVDELQPGSILFYRRRGEGRYFHTALHICNLDEFGLINGDTAPIGPIAIESGGAGSFATSPREALKVSAGVRMTASDIHGKGVAWVAKDPFSLLSFD